MRLVLGIFLLAAFIPRANAQKCFCDAASKKAGNVYFLIKANGDAFTFGEGNFRFTTYTPGGGLRIGTNISEEISIQSGVDYFQLNHISTTGYYPYSDHQMIEIPVDFVFRFPNEINRFTPYISLSAVNSIQAKGKYYQETDPLIAPKYTSGYSGFYAGIGGGILIQFSDQAALNFGFGWRQNLAALKESQNLEIYSHQIGVQLGFQYHF